MKVNGYPNTAPDLTYWPDWLDSTEGPFIPGEAVYVLDREVLYYRNDNLNAPPLRIPKLSKAIVRACAIQYSGKAPALQYQVDTDGEANIYPTGWVFKVEGRDQWFTTLTQKFEDFDEGGFTEVPSRTILSRTQINQTFGNN